MLRNYIKIAYRNLLKNKVYSFINIIGLAVGLATCLIITLYVLDDLSFDAHQPKADRIGLFQQFPNSSSSGSAFGELLKKRTGIEAVTQISPNRALISKLNFADYETRFCLADSNLTRIFEFPMVVGSLRNALILPNKVVISERIAVKYFANSNPIGQTIEVQLNGKATFLVVGVMKNSPDNTHLIVDFLASSQNAKNLLSAQKASFWDFIGMNYFLLSPRNSFANVTKQLSAIQKETKDANAGAWKLSVIPLRDIYLKNITDDRIRATNAIEFVRIFLAVGISILLLACFNYLNLSLARATLRAKEVGVRKVIGAERKQLIGQFLGESLVFTFIATVLAINLVQIILPFFNDFAEKSVSLKQFFTPFHFTIFICFILLASLITGLYPAFVLSGFRPILVLKNYLLPSSGLSFLRKGLVIIQFSVSVIMIVATMVVMNQLYFLQHKDLGYKREQILTLNLPPQSTSNQRNLLQNELAKMIGVKEVTAVSILPGNGIGFNKVSPQSLKNQQDDPTIGQLYIDAKYKSVFGIKLLEGRFFEENNIADKKNYVVSREATSKFGWKLGQIIGYIKYENSPTGAYAEVPVNGQIIGIVEDFNQMDLKSPIFPLMMINDNNSGQLAIKLGDKNYSSIIEKVAIAWKKQYPEYPFEYKFLDEQFNQTYHKEVQTSRVFGLFATLAIFISCLGLFGLVTFMAEQRNKEIGIRKVLGASVSSILILLSKDFVKLILLSIIIATPIAYYLMFNWLKDFAFKTNLHWWIFVAAGAISIIISLLTVSYQAIKAALMNPVKSLKTE